MHSNSMCCLGSIRLRGLTLEQPFVFIWCQTEGLTPRRRFVMRIMRAVVLATLATALWALLGWQATAADLGGGRSRIARSEPAPDLPEFTPFSWTGLYVGAHAGYGWSEIEWQEGAFSGSHD